MIYYYLAVTIESNDLGPAAKIYDYLSYGYSIEETMAYIDTQLEVVAQLTVTMSDSLLV